MRYTALDRVRTLVGVDPDLEIEQYQAAAADLRALREREAAISAELKAYQAEFYRNGQTSHYDNERRAFLASLAMERRLGIEQSGEKITGLAQYLDDYAHAHPDYLLWLRKKHERRLDMARLEGDLARVQAEIEAAQMQLKLAENRVRLTQSLIGFARAAANANI